MDLCCDILSIREKHLTATQIYKYGIIYICCCTIINREIYIFVPHLRTARLVLDYLTIARDEARSADSGSS